MLAVAFAATIIASSLPLQTSIPESPASAPTDQPSGSPEPASYPPPPPWVFDAGWYMIYVPRFCNGAKENDPPGTRPWARPLNPPDAKPEDLFTTARIPYGGDLQGVRSKLHYVKELGFTAICLDGVFADDPSWEAPLGKPWHVDPVISLPATGAGAAQPSSTSDPEWTPGDRLLLELVREAHALNLKVLVAVPLIVAEPEGAPHKRWEGYRPALGVTEAIPQMTRWLKPSPGGAIVEGLDGFSVTLDDECPEDVRRRLLEALYGANPNAAVLGHRRDHHARMPSFPAVATSGPRPGSVYAATEDLAYAGWATYLEKQLRGASPPGPGVVIHEFSSVWDGRMASQFKNYLRDASDVKAQWLRCLRGWRLGLAVTMCLPNSTMLMYGDEVGMTGVQADASLSPMWWLEPGSKEPPSPDYRADFTALVRLMNRIRSAHEPLRRGNFEVVMADDARRVLVFARTYGDKQVIVVVNAASTRQEVEITAGVPGGLVGVMRPELEPLLPRSKQALVDPTKPVLIEPKLRIAGNRTIVDAGGKVRLNMDPMSLKLVLVGGDVGQ